MPHPPRSVELSWLGLGSWIAGCCSVERAGSNAIHGAAVPVVKPHGQQKDCLVSDRALGQWACTPALWNKEDLTGHSAPDTPVACGASPVGPPQTGALSPALSRASSWCDSITPRAKPSERITTPRPRQTSRPPLPPWASGEGNGEVRWSSETSGRERVPSPISSGRRTRPSSVPSSAGRRQRLPRAPSASPRTNRSSPRTPEEQVFWASVVCTRIEAGPEGNYVFQPCDMLQLLQCVWSRPIAAYTEFRHAFRTSDLVPLPPPLGMHHSFLVLELDGSSRQICLERFDNSMEMMLADREVLRSVATRYRATGEPRVVDGERPVEDLPRVRLGTWAGLPMVRAEDLYAWIKGPLATSWQPHELTTAKWQHFSGDLQQFLRSGKNEVRAHSLHLRPPKVPP
mmetsp:Transcript_4251/g.13686  ORF Transcript_4251/g.13686 Transcript_4251/m.13686 type:complete len:400 (-) Transcript_4251:147-1346(-)